MATAKQIEANRRNAQKSTGPKTEAGRAKSRLNALQHGLGAIHVPLPHENPNELAETLAGLMNTYQPANAQEQMLVHNIASAFLRIQRASRFEASILNGEIINLKSRHNKSLAAHPDDDLGAVIAMANGDFQKAWELLDRYEKRAQSAYYRAIETLRRIQNDRKREPVRQMKEEEAKERYLRKTVAAVTPLPASEMASFGERDTRRKGAPPPAEIPAEPPPSTASAVDLCLVGPLPRGVRGL